MTYRYARQSDNASVFAVSDNSDNAVTARRGFILLVGRGVYFQLHRGGVACTVLASRRLVS